MQKNTAVIRLDAIRHNAEIFSGLAGVKKFCAVVKADAYGHGAAAVAQTLHRTADFFAVSLVEEGAQLRHAGTVNEILVLTPALCEEEVVRGIAEELIFTVGDTADYELLLRTCEKYDLTARCHIKANTGMNRYGFSYAGFCKFLKRKLSDRVIVEGIYSHFYRPENALTSHTQFVLFEKFSEAAKLAFGGVIRHIAATGGTLASSDYRLDMVRIGIGLYGYLPEGFELQKGLLKPAMRIYGQVAAVRRRTYGGAGYGPCLYEGKLLGVVRAGYADGFFRSGGINNVNNLCMDAYLTAESYKKYDNVCIFSDADAYAAAHDTISYEVLVNAGRRAERIYVEG